MKWLRWLLWAALAAACVGIAFDAPGALNAYQTLETERNATPTPTADTASMLHVTIDPNNTPAPTAMVLKRGMDNDAVGRACSRRYWTSDIMRAPWTGSTATAPCRP